jgi:hypothetical protein
MIKGRL